MMIVRFLIPFLILIPSLCFGATYYVRTDGHNTNCNGLTDASAASSPNCAFLTVQKGVNIATTARDTVTIHSGDYTAEGKISSAANGSAGNLITIQGYSDETVSLTNFSISHNYNKFDNFTLTLPGTSCDGSQAAIIFGGSNNIASNNYIFGNDVSSCNTQCPIGVLFSSGSYNNALSNTFEGYFTYVFITHSANNTIQNNTVKNIVDVERIFDVIFTSSSVSDGTTVTGNEIYNYTSPQTKCYNHPDIFQVVNHGESSSAYNWVITNNYFHDCESSIGINEAASVSTGWIFRNNVFANIRDAMALLTDYTRVENNTFFQVAETQAGVMDCCYDHNEVRNNIIIGANAGSTYGMINKVSGTPTLGYNFFSLPRANSYGARDATAYSVIKGAGSINGGDPKFVDVYDDCVANTCDFKLQLSSPLKDVGATLTGFATDKDGVFRPQGSAWDIGAYEYIQAGDTTPPSAPSGVVVI